MNLSHSSTRCNVLEFEHCWEITDFYVQQQIRRTGDSLKTEGFGNDDYKFQLQLFPNGKDEGYKEYISVFLTVLKCIGRLRLRVAFEVETLKGPIECALNRNIVTLNATGIVTASKFFKISTLLEDSDTRLPNGCLRLKAKISVFEDSHTDTVDLGCIDDTFALNATRQTFSSNLSLLSTTGENASVENVNGLLDFYENGHFSDFTVNIGSRKFYLHRVILASRSNYFRAMLEPHTKEGGDCEVVLRDVEPDMCAHVFRYMYTNCSNTFLDCAEDVMRLADRFLMDDLLLTCANHLSKSIQLNNVCGLMELADNLNSRQLFDKCIIFFLRHVNQILDSAEWCKLKHCEPHLTARILEHFVTHSNPAASSKRLKVNYSLQ